MDGGSYYDLLGVPPDASETEIRAAYRAKAKEAHPDRSDAPDASERFKRLTRARDVLTDETERARYDRLGHERYTGEDVAGPTTERTDHQQGNQPGDRREARWRREERKRRGTDEDARWEAYDRERTSREKERERRAREYRRQQRAKRMAAEHRWWDGDEEAYRRTQRTVGPESASGRDSTMGRRQGGNTRRARRQPRGRANRGLSAGDIGLGVTAFLLYPVLLASSVLPAFPPAVNVVVGVCTLLLVVYLLTVPEVAVFVFGGWAFLAPFGLAALGVGVLSAVGLVALTAIWIPFALACVNLLFMSG
ncbi:J domain-containing protein [Natronomonas sp. EA1]|uniref:J domain-containing protein n=1 Tax=Natronomonas sp. EA1 TaxID=3421655 RepID=UPI003EBE0532